MNNVTDNNNLLTKELIEDKQLNSHLWFVKCNMVAVCIFLFSCSSNSTNKSANESVKNIKSKLPGFSIEYHNGPLADSLKGDATVKYISGKKIVIYNSSSCSRSRK
jgi:hypothetical protein